MVKIKKPEKFLKYYLIFTLFFLSAINSAFAENRAGRREKELHELQKRFEWWPTDATPGPVKDEKRGGYWWWPNTAGRVRPWGNRGYIYVCKIIFDYKEEELPAPKPRELRPSLLIKKIIKNVKIYFDYDKADLRDDAKKILRDTLGTLKRNPESTILITGNCDRRGPEAYNEKLGRRRAEAVKRFMLENDIPDERIRIVSRGKLDAIAPITDLVGMQKDRNAQFMVAEVEEVMIPYMEETKEPEARSLGEGKYIIEKSEQVESEVKVSTRQYTVKKDDTLKKIAQEQLGGSHRWKYLYEFNKGRIKDPASLEAGTIIIIPIEQEQARKVSATATATRPIEQERPKKAPAATTAAGTRLYTINKDDSLWKIAQKQLGNGKRWKEIYALNKDKIKNPDKLISGTKIILPDK